MTSGNTEIYVSIDGNEYHKLDLFNDESINIKFVKKDAQDISKVFAPFSKGFSVPATPKNIRVLNHFGDTSLIRSYNSASLKCKIYVKGILNKEGTLKIENIKYSNNKVVSFNVAFNSKVLSFKERMGEDTLSDLFTGNELIDWSPKNVFESVSTTKTNGITWYTPLISRFRVWFYNPDVTPTSDNIAYNSGNSPLYGGLVRLEDLRPAVSVKSLFRLIKDKYNLAINLPLENEQRFSNAYIWANGSNFRPDSRKFIIKKNFSQDEYSAGKRATVDLTDSSIKIEKGVGVVRLLYIISFVNLVFHDRKTPENAKANVTIRLIDKDTGELFYSQNFVFENSVSSAAIEIDRPYAEVFTKDVYTFIDTDTPMTWESNNSSFRFFTSGAGITTGSYTGNVSSFETGLSLVPILNALPEMKCVDFVSNLIKTFNITIFESSKNDGVLDFLTDSDVKDTSKIYGKRVSDITKYISSLEVEKKVIDQYNYYKFKHNDSQYKSSIDYKKQFGVEYGLITQPETKPEQSREYVIETGFSIIPPVSVNGYDDFITAYGFTNDTPVDIDGFLRYQPNTDDITLFYKDSLTALNPTGMQSCNGANALINASLTSYFPTAPFGINSLESLAFNILVHRGVSYYDTLYKKYFEPMIQQLLDVNTLEHTFEAVLPVNEIVFALSTGIQPEGFRLQNDIIIQETRYNINEMEIDIVTGKAKMKLLNL